MHSTQGLTRVAMRRKNERGAALITTLLISMMLLAAGSALIVSTSMTTANTFDSTAEAQAYYGAEAGLQAALNVLRNHATSISPTTLKMDFRKAVTINTSYTSNRSGDPSTGAGVARLSNWLPYTNYADATSRVVVNTGSAYSAYTIAVSDPDNIPATSLPNRLLVISKGYGPRGAQKELRMVVDRSMFNIYPPAPITIRGSDVSTDSMHYDLGDSAAKTYSGADRDGIEPVQPSTAISLHDWTAGNDGIHKPGSVNNPKFGILDLDPVPSAGAWPASLTPVPAAGSYPNSVPTPYFLVNGDAARAFLKKTKSVATDMGRYYTSATFTSVLGDYADSGTRGDAAYTFVEGDITLNGGTGLLICTGNVALKGNDGFDGIVIALGKGHIDRSGGGNGGTFGAFVIGNVGLVSGGFGAPYFDTSGGGGSTLQNDHSSKEKANDLAGHPVAGVVER